MGNNTTSRQSNYELLRIVALLLITSMHAAAQIGFFRHPLSEAVSPFNAWLGVVVNAVGNTGVTCFVLISGFFGVKYMSSKFLHLVLTVTLYSLLLHFLFLLSGVGAKSDLAEALLAVPLYHNWFIICYLFLMLIAPYLNSFAERLERRSFTRLLIILFVTLSLIPTLFHHASTTLVTDGGKCATYFLFVYLFGRYLRLHNNHFRFSRLKLTVTLIASLLLIIAVNGVGSVVRNQYLGMLSKDNSPLILIASVCIFLLFGTISIKSRPINRIAQSMLAVYILNNVFRIIDHLFIHLSDYSHSPLSAAMLTVEVLLTFAVCIAIDESKRLLLSRAEETLVSTLIKLWQRLRRASHVTS